MKIFIQVKYSNNNKYIIILFVKIKILKCNNNLFKNTLWKPLHMQTFLRNMKIQESSKLFQ